MPVYRKYPSMSGNLADLHRRISNLENEESLIARVAALEALVPPSWITQTVKINDPDPDTVAGTAVMTDNGGTLTSAAGDGSYGGAFATAYFEKMTAMSNCELYVEMQLGTRADYPNMSAMVGISLNCAPDGKLQRGSTYHDAQWATQFNVGTTGRPAVQGYQMSFFGDTTQNTRYAVTPVAAGVTVAYGSADTLWDAATDVSHVTCPAFDGGWTAVRFNVSNGLVSTKVWPLGGAEPAVWQFSYRLKDPAAGLGVGKLELTQLTAWGTPWPVTFRNITVTPT